MKIQYFVFRSHGYVGQGFFPANTNSGIVSYDSFSMKPVDQDFKPLRIQDDDFSRVYKITPVILCLVV